MPDTPYLLAAVAVSAAVTWSLRAPGPCGHLVPAGPALHRPGTAARQRRRRLPQRPHAAGRDGDPGRLQPGNLPLADPPQALPAALALAVTLGLHLWRRNPVLSILGGTAVHVALASTFFAY